MQRGKDDRRASPASRPSWRADCSLSRSPLAAKAEMATIPCCLGL